MKDTKQYRRKVANYGKREGIDSRTKIQLHSTPRGVSNATYGNVGQNNNNNSNYSQDVLV